MRYFIILIAIAFVSATTADAQELNAKLTINTQRLTTPNKELFSSLESNINRLLNEQKWTNTTFSRDERINCSVTMSVNEMTDQNTFSAEIQVVSNRPVYNSTYITSLLSFRDTRFDFTYMQGESLDYNDLTINNNIVAVIAFYANIIIGLDFDSFSPNGGKPYFARAMEIANMAQSLGTSGWEPFSGKNNNRYDLAMALTEPSSADFHTLWYAYHRTGLDEMAANPSRGRIRSIEAFNQIKQLYDARPSSPLITILGETKVPEIVRICAEATAEEKKNMKELLLRIYPTKSLIINDIR